jgi:hypothetical protein
MKDNNYYASLMYCLEQRAAILGLQGSWEWVLNDPVVGCFAPALYILDLEGYLKLSSTLRQKTREIYWINTGLWLKREHQLKEILDQLEQSKIEFVPLKGAALLKTIYPKIGLRTMTDIDILVRPIDFLKAARIFADGNLQPGWSFDSEDLFGFASLPPEFWPGELSFSNQQHLRIDLHQEMVTYQWFRLAFPVDIDSVWERCVRYSNSDELYWKMMLSPYDMLLNMCLHLALHGLQIMKNFYDVDLFLRNLPSDWDWKRFISIIKNSQLCSAAFHTFIFCQEFFRTPIPIQVLSALKPNRFDTWQVKLLITPKDILENRPSLGLRYPSLVKFALFDRSKIKIKSLLNLLFPSRQWLERHYASAHLFSHWTHLVQVLLRGD